MARLDGLRDEFKLRPPNPPVHVHNVPPRFRRGLQSAQVQMLVYFACRGKKRPGTILQLLTEVALDAMEMQLAGLMTLPQQPPPSAVISALYFGMGSDACWTNAAPRILVACCCVPILAYKAAVKQITQRFVTQT